MSLENEQIKKEEVVVEEVNSTELVEVDKEAKKAKIKKVAKKVGKVAAVAGVGLLGFLLGRGSGKKSAYNESEAIDVEYDVEQTEE